MTKQERKTLRELGRALRARIAELDRVLGIRDVAASDAGERVEQLIIDLGGDANTLRGLVRGDHVR